MKKCIILANGRPPKKSTINHLVSAGYTELICADGGANSAYRMNLIPDYIIGDFDSIKNNVIQRFRNKSILIKISRQNDTDVEKCLKYAIRKKFSAAVLTGVTGDRLDHTFCNLGIAVKFFNKIKITVIAENSILQAFSGYNEIPAVPGETISVYGLDNKTTINSKGLKYKLKNTSLPFGSKESTSNIALKNRIILSVTGGIIFVVRDYNVMRKNGFILSD